MTSAPRLTVAAGYRQTGTGSIMARSKPYTIVEDSGFLRCCSRCPQTWTVKTRRVALTLLCDDCKEVLTPEERRAYKSKRRTRP